MKEIFAENTVYACMAVIGSVLFILKLVLFFFVGDSDIDGEFDAGEGGESFSFISTQSILAFLMGAGWMGLAATREWELDSLKSLFCSAGFGFAMMGLSSFLTFKIKGLNSSPKADLKDALGKIGRAYTNIPAKGQGIGQIEITVNDKQQILQASSYDESEIKAFESVKVESVDDSGNMIVIKA